MWSAESLAAAHEMLLDEPEGGVAEADVVMNEIISMKGACRLPLIALHSPLACHFTSAGAQPQVCTSRNGCSVALACHQVAVSCMTQQQSPSRVSLGKHEASGF